jgi:hypothetical protein
MKENNEDIYRLLAPAWRAASEVFTKHGYADVPDGFFHQGFIPAVKAGLKVAFEHARPAWEAGMEDLAINTVTVEMAALGAKAAKDWLAQRR